MLYVDDTYYNQDYFTRCFSAFDNNEIIRQCRNKRFSVCVGDTAFWLALCLYLKKHGASVFPLPVDTPIEAARRRANKSASHFLIFGEEGGIALENIEKIATQGDDDKAVLVQMSSGTTGEAKYVERTWKSIDSEIESYINHFASANTMTPVVACPVTHSYGLICGVLVALKRGVQPLIVNNLNPKYIIRKLYEIKSPLLYSSPTLITAITMLIPEEKPIYAVMTSGSVLPAAWFKNIQKKVKHMHQQYGCSEVGCIALGQNIAAANEMGTPLPHIVVSAGFNAEAPAEIVVSTMQGSAQTEGLGTRDLGYMEESTGRLHFVSRLDDMINVSGFNVYPYEVEEVVLAMPQVTEAVVFKRSHHFGSDQVCLQYVSGAAIPDQLIREWCVSKLAKHQVPMHIEHVDVIPKLPNGKISRKSLAAISIV